MKQLKATAHRYSITLHHQSDDPMSDPLLESSPLFTGIQPGDCKSIVALARTKEFQRGEMLYIEGDSIRQVLLLTSGLVKVTKLGPTGTEVILRLSGAGDVLGAAGPLGIGAHGTTAQAFRACRALVWEAPRFKSLVAPFPVLHQNFCRILLTHLLELEERFREVATVRVGPRVARQVVRLLEQIGRPVDGAIELSLSREELAQMTGTTLFTVSRLFSAWEALGMVKPRREAVTICNLPSLRSLAQEN